MSDDIRFEDKNEFIEWLEENHKDTNELWVVFSKKNAVSVNLTWSDAVDCALAFGWIDGIRKKVDEDHYKVRFTPRKSNSIWSKVNIDKANNLIQSNQMRPEGMDLFSQRKDQTGYSSKSRQIELAQIYEDELKKNPQVWEFFTELSPSYKRDSIWWIMSAKKEATRVRRLDRLIKAWQEEKTPRF